MSSYFPGVSPRLKCYRLTERNSYDEEAVWALVQRHGGELAVTALWIDFWLAPQWTSLLLMMFPNLEQRCERDLY